LAFLAGIYPALVLSSFVPITVLKGRFVSGSKGLILRKGLVVVQFTISIALIAATIIVYTQLHYMRNQDWVSGTIRYW
jgi:putative ABC transport system permease protein